MKNTFGPSLLAIGGQALAIGVLVVFVGGFGGLLLAPAYGLAISVLVCRPLAARLR